ncbi:hypothetical protein [Aquimarina agarilytica]|uniref:hypothetical protein n=1 Tax=Aquimarina agarilytica TaxID=1087449 RepID=UPI00030E1F28|nr:hypothetical protein [Aquimarina agarilytica]
MKQAKADGIEELNKAISVQQNDKQVKCIVATVGEFGCDSETIENKDDFKNWAIAKLTLEPKDANKKEEYLEYLTECKETKLYLVIDAESKDKNWKEVLYDEVFDATPNVWLKEEGKQFGLRNNTIY